MNIRQCCAATIMALAAMAAGGTAAAEKQEPGAPGGQVVDAARMWKDFLATAEATTAYAAFDALDLVGYTGDAVDAAQCTEHGDELKAAVAKAPISIAVRRAAFLCADATHDDAAAAREMETLLALSRYALGQASDSPQAPPIRIMVPLDAFALLSSSGMSSRYEYYVQLHPTRYFPLVVVGWDEAAKVERRFRFDYVDTAYELSRSEFRGYPIVRAVMADAFVEGGAKNDLLAAVDAAAIQAAAQESNPADKIAKLRRSAASGGVQAALAWLLVCDRESADKDCANGLVDGLLPSAEAKHAMHMMLLAYAHLDGVGVKRDPAAAWALLDAADKVSQGKVLPEFASTWVTAHPKEPLPAELEARLLRAKAQGDSSAGLVLLGRKLMSGHQLDDAELAFLAGKDFAPGGLGQELLAGYYGAIGRKQDAVAATRIAADAGNASSQARYGRMLLTGGDGVERNVVLGEKMLEQAAQGGNAWAARYLAQRSGSQGDFAAAEKWLLAPARAADVDAIMQLAALYAAEYPGVSEKADHAVRIYTSLASGGEGGAPARRALAALALEGKGMPKDPGKALQWLRGDAERGDHESESMLGTHYLLGSFGKADEAEGERWLERALKANTASAYSNYGNWLYGRNTPASRAKGLEVWAKGDAAGYTSSTNAYAWALCTSAHDDDYDPKRGLEAAKRMGTSDLITPAQLDTLAACYAAVGDFSQAVELQVKAAKQLAAYDTGESKRKRAGKPAEYEERLTLYRAKHPYRQQ